MSQTDHAPSEANGRSSLGQRLKNSVHKVLSFWPVRLIWSLVKWTVWIIIVAWGIFVLYGLIISLLAWP